MRKKVSISKKIRTFSKRVIAGALASAVIITGGAFSNVQFAEAATNIKIIMSDYGMSGLRASTGSGKNGIKTIKLADIGVSSSYKVNTNSSGTASNGYTGHYLSATLSNETTHTVYRSDGRLFIDGNFLEIPTTYGQTSATYWVIQQGSTGGKLTVTNSPQTFQLQNGTNALSLIPVYGDSTQDVYEVHYYFSGANGTISDNEISNRMLSKASTGDYYGYYLMSAKHAQYPSFYHLH